MADNMNPLAPHVLPFYAPGADGSDQMMFTTGVVMAFGILMLGVVFFHIHSLPERMAHRTQKVQMEVVAVLCLLALVSHIHAFWVAALLLAMIDLPTMAQPVERIAGSLERIADRTGPATPPVQPDPEAQPAPPAAPNAPTPQTMQGA